MPNRSNHKWLYPLFFLLLILAVTLAVKKEILFDWSNLRSGTQELLTLVWLAMILSVVGLLTVFITNLNHFRFSPAWLHDGLIIMTTFFCIGCLLLEAQVFVAFHGGERCFPYTLTTQISWKSPVVPLVVSIDAQGHIVLSGNTSFETPLGDFEVTTDLYQVPDADNQDNGVTTLVIRHREGATVRDTKYYLRSSLDSVQIETRGLIVTQVKKNFFLIDASKGTIEKTEVHITPANGACSVPIVE